MTQDSGEQFGVIPVEELPELPSDAALLQKARELPASGRTRVPQNTGTLTAIG